MSRNFMVVHANPGDTPIIIFVDSITAIKDYGDSTCCIYTLDDKFYNVTESLADIMRKFNTGHCRIVND